MPQPAARGAITFSFKDRGHSAPWWWEPPSTCSCRSFFPTSGVSEFQWTHLKKRRRNRRRKRRRRGRRRRKRRTAYKTPEEEQSCVATQEPVSESIPLSPNPPYSKFSRIGSCPVSLRKRSRSSGVSPMEALLVMGWKKTMSWPPFSRFWSRTSFTLWSLSKSTESAVAQPCPTLPGGGATVRLP